MLAALAKAKTSVTDVSETEAFRVALAKTQNNITEIKEPAAIDMISRYYQAAFTGDKLAGDRTIRAIIDLGTINRNAMRRADVKLFKVVVYLIMPVFLAIASGLTLHFLEYINRFEELTLLATYPEYMIFSSINAL